MKKKKFLLINLIFECRGRRELGVYRDSHKVNLEFRIISLVFILTRTNIKNSVNP